MTITLVRSSTTSSRLGVRLPSNLFGVFVFGVLPGGGVTPDGVCGSGPCMAYGKPVST